jgi:hypothetical protein
MTIATWFISRASAAEQEPSSLKLHTLPDRLRLIPPRFVVPRA